MDHGLLKFITRLLSIPLFLLSVTAFSIEPHTSKTPTLDCNRIFSILSNKDNALQENIYLAKAPGKRAITARTDTLAPRWAHEYTGSDLYLRWIIDKLSRKLVKSDPELLMYQQGIETVTKKAYALLPGLQKSDEILLKLDQLAQSHKDGLITLSRETLKNLQEKDKVFVIESQFLHELGHDIFYANLKASAPDILKEFDNATQASKYINGAKEREKRIEAMTKYLINLTAQETFADLLACSVMNDPDAMRKSLDITAPGEAIAAANALRTNSQVLSLPTKNQIKEGPTIDTYTELNYARVTAWHRYLRSEGDREYAFPRIYRALEKWIRSEYKKVDREGSNYRFDKNQANETVLNLLHQDSNN